MKKIDLKKFRLNKSKVRKITKYALVIAIILAAVMLFPSTLSIYSSNGTSTPEVDMAYSLLKIDKLEDNIRLDNLVPDGKARTYVFSVQNYDGDQIIDVKMKYHVELKSTTNLPIQYELGYYDNSGNSHTIQKSGDEYITTDDDGTKWVILETEEKDVTFNSKLEDKYYIKYTFPDTTENKNSKYQDISELMMIKIYSEQVM